MAGVGVCGGLGGGFQAVGYRHRKIGGHSFGRGVVTPRNRSLEVNGCETRGGTRLVVGTDLMGVRGRLTRHNHGVIVSASSVDTSDECVEETTTTSNRPPLRVLFAAGGTGGHVFPAVAVADALVERSNGDTLPYNRQVEIHFAGTAGRQESKLVPNAGYDLHLIPAVSLARPLFSPVNMLKNLILPFRLAWCLLKAIQLVKKINPHVVVGTGGYVSFPVCLAAWIKKIPMCVQEQNAFPGIANRVLATVATKVFVAFREAADTLLRAETMKIHGNPTRGSLRTIPRSDARRQIRFWFDMQCGVGYKGQLMDDSLESLEKLNNDPDSSKKLNKSFVLLILGGSLGAGAINKAVGRIVPKLLEEHPDLWILWQTGDAGYDKSARDIQTSFPKKKTKSRENKNNPHPRLSIVPFIDRMDVTYGACDLVVARAGAVTCAELVATKSPAVLIPSPNVAEDHQTKNAVALKEIGVAEVLPEAELSGGNALYTMVTTLLTDPDRLTQMSSAAAAKDTPNAAEEIAEDVARLAKR